MQGKIGLEEHFALKETAGSVVYKSDDRMTRRLLDVEDLRLEQMDKAGMERMIVSLNAPAVQEIADPQQAVSLARRANETLADKVAKRPDRFSGFAALPMQEPEAAILELDRAVKEYGFVGALVNGFSNTPVPDAFLYYDMPQYLPFWKRLEELGVPFYLHPREPAQKKSYEGHPWLAGPVWGFSAETGLHALRLICSGLFDKFPNLRIILGHIGEGIPFYLHRMDARLAWGPMGVPMKTVSVSHYFNRNFYITTAGNFRTQSLIDAMHEVGADRIMFSTDYPMEEATEAAEWFDAAPIAEADRLKIGRTNAQNLFNLA